jgi:hypothetical protein
MLTLPALFHSPASGGSTHARFPWEYFNAVLTQYKVTAVAGFSASTLCPSSSWPG